jgi:hypothetical protein
MTESRLIPTSLKVVAVLFVLSGLSSLVEVIYSLGHGNLSINIGVLGLFIGPGLLRLSRGWRTWALVFTWLAIIVTPIAAVAFLAAQGPIEFRLFGRRVSDAPTALGVGMAALVFLVALWQYRVLTRPDVRALFRLPDTSPATAPEEREG